VVAQFQFRDRGRIIALQGIGAGVTVTQESVGIDQLQYPYLVLLVRQTYPGQAGDTVTTETAGQAAEFVANFRMRQVHGNVVIDLWEVFEVVAPLRRHVLGVVQPGLVQSLEVGHVAAGRQGGTLQRLHQLLGH
jgi:hypothetical protein